MWTTFVRKTCGWIACLALVGAPSSAPADLIANVEPNNTFGTAQVIPFAAFTLDFSPNIGTGAGAAS